MSTLLVSTGIDALAAALLKNLAGERREPVAPKHSEGGRDPFIPSTIIVPNRNLKKWLQLRIAREDRIALNLNFEYLEEGLWKLLRAFDPNRDEKPRLLTAQPLQLAILSVLLDERARTPEMAPLNAYVGGRNDENRRNYYRKAWQLSGALARHFRDYEYHRAEMIECWHNRSAYFNGRQRPDVVAMETCQRALWLEVFAMLERTSESRLTTLPEYARKVMERLRAAPPAEPLHLEPIHIFGVSQISTFHTRLLQELGARVDLKIYHLNALAAPLGRPGLSNAAQRSAFRDIAARIPKDAASDGLDLCAQLGGAGRESLHLFSGLLEDERFEFQYLSEEPEPLPRQSMLGRVQEVLLAPQPRAADPAAQDRSIQILAAPGIHREAETVYNSILQNMQADPQLKLTDIAVLTTDMARYRPVIQSVFGRESWRLPYNLSDFSAAEQSSFGQGLLSLLDLALSPFTRSKVFETVMNPCFLAAAGVERSDALVWMDWAVKLNIYHTFDAADKAERGYAENPFYTWQHGLRRLRLGRIMELAPPAAGGASVQEYKGVAPFADMESADNELLGAFCELIELLQRRLSELRKLSAGGAVWRGKIASLAGDFLAIPEDRPEEEEVRRGLIQALSQLPQIDEFFKARGHTPAIELPAVCEFLRENLNGIDSSVGSYLTGGVTISALQPMRPIPFKVVYLMGLGEGCFPGFAPHSALDLRSVEPRRGDINIPDTNRYLFLESLLSTRQKLYLSYVSKDLEKAETLYPCSVLKLLARHLEEKIGTGKFQTVEIPLKGSSTRYLDENEQTPWSDAVVNYAIPDRLVALLDPSNAELLNLSAPLKKQVLAREASLRPDFSPVKAVREEQAGVEPVSTRELAAFLRNPIEGSIKRHLRLYDEHDEEVGDDEPFFTGSFEAKKWLAEFLHDFVAARIAGAPDSEWPERFKRAYDTLKLRCAAPDGAFEEIDRAYIEEKARERIGELVTFLDAQKPNRYIGPLEIGPQISGESANEALTLHREYQKGRAADVAAAQPFIWEDGNQFEFVALVISPFAVGSQNRLPSALFEPFLFHIALLLSRNAAALAAGKKPEPGIKFTVCISGENQSALHRFDLSASEAEEYFDRLLGDYLDRDAFDLLPFKIIEKDKTLRNAFTLAEDPKLREKYAEMLSAAIDDDQEGSRPDYRPMELLGLINALIPSDAYEKVRRRFELLASCLEDSESEAPGA